MKTEALYHISALKKGNKESFKWLFDQHKVALYSYVWSLLKSDKWADDVCSEVFIAIWNNRSKIRPETFKTYLFQIAKNKVFNQLKKIAADARQEEEYIHRYVEYTENPLDVKEVTNYRTDLLKKEIDNLPPKRKEIIERKYFQGQKSSQIARDMGITIHTVKVQLYKARLYLKSRLGDETGNI